MARTYIRSGLLQDGSVWREDLNTADTGKAVVRKVLVGTGMYSSYTGVDNGTGDVTLAAPSQLNSPDGLISAAIQADNDGQIGIGTSSPGHWLHIFNSTSAGNMMQVEGLPQTNGSDPVTFTLKSRRSGTWTDGAAYANLDFYSRDASGAGEGVKARISAYNDGTTGGGVGLKFYTDSGSGLAPAFRFDKDNRVQMGSDSQTGTGRLNIFPSAASQSAWTAKMFTSHSSDLAHIYDSSDNSLFYIDNSNDMFLRSGVFKFDSNETTGSGVASLPSATSTVNVTFDNAMDDTNYSINICPSYQTSFWYTNKATTGFTINVGTQDPTYARNIDWSIRPY